MLYSGHLVNEFLSFRLLESFKNRACLFYHVSNNLSTDGAQEYKAVRVSIYHTALGDYTVVHQFISYGTGRLYCIPVHIIRHWETIL